LGISANTGPGEFNLIRTAVITRWGKNRIRKKIDPTISMDLFAASKLEIFCLLAPEIILGQEIITH
jgi:hypothetical protein